MDIPVKAIVEEADPAASVTGFAPVDLYQKREKIFTRNITGRFQRLRLYTGWPLLLGYLFVPWLSWNDRPLVLFDIPARQFHLGGLTFFPQDFMLLGWLLIIAAFALFMITSVVGRLWCGYTCPQTIWTSIFMWMEQVAEGTRNQRMRLDQAPWSLDKVMRRALKHGMWLGWALLTGFTFVAYFVPAPDLALNLATFNAPGWPLFWTLFFTCTTYVNAGWMREQVCIYMCPYARFQSAMVDRDTLVVSYDRARGEPRGSRRADADRATLDLGDCIECQLCVQVCPTGIDIRDGLQYQCIDCAQCIDACDQIMARMDYAPGLIRYTTQRNLDGGQSHLLRPKVIGYALALGVMSALFAWVMVTRTPFEIDVARDRGELFQRVDDQIRNAYSLTLINKSQQAQTMRLRAEIAGVAELRFDAPAAVTVAPGNVENVPVRILIEQSMVVRPVMDVIFSACVDDVGCVSETNRFLAPLPPVAPLAPLAPEQAHD
jgi:cytochrome c oxidase accessory protein FixG